MHGVRYRLWQFTSSVRALLLPPRDREARQILSPAAYALFRRMARYDRAHSLRVLQRLRERGVANPVLLQAALLHDVGKSAGEERIPLLYRGLVVISRHVPHLWTWLARERPPGDLRRPFYLYATHAARGATLARAAGCAEDVVRLIAAHEDDGEGEEAVRLLQAADRQS